MPGSDTFDPIITDVMRELMAQIRAEQAGKGINQTMDELRSHQQMLEPTQPFEPSDQAFDAGRFRLSANVVDDRPGWDSLQGLRNSAKWANTKLNDIPVRYEPGHGAYWSQRNDQPYDDREPE